MRDDSPFGRQYLQNRITGEFAIARHMGIVVESADESGLVLSAPLGPNANHQGTAFGGSLFSLAALTGWAWVTRYLEVARLPADAVIQASSVRYVTPVHGTLCATLAAPAAAAVEKFGRMLQRAGRGRIELHVDILHERKVATEFEGVFAAAVR